LTLLERISALKVEVWSMSFEGDAAKRYRLHAARLRSMATTHNDPETLEALAGVAASYDLMANVFDGVSEASLTTLKARKAN
jgi:hypothetical protein